MFIQVMKKIIWKGEEIIFLNEDILLFLKDMPVS